MGAIEDVNGLTGRGVVTRQAVDPVDALVDRLLEVLRARGIKVFAVIDHSGEAATAGQVLPNTKLVIFGNPTLGTPLMRATPLVALDLPLKILIWERDDQQVCVSYNAPAHLADRYGISDEDQVRVLSSVELLVDAIVEPATRAQGNASE